jgi:hypothetical protein
MRSTQLVHIFHIMYSYITHPQNDTIQKIERCIIDIEIWSTKNKLFLNDGKTEVIHISSKFRVPFQLDGINVADCTIAAVAEVRNLGVIFDKKLCIDTHVSLSH